MSVLRTAANITRMCLYGVSETPAALSYRLRDLPVDDVSTGITISTTSYLEVMT